MDTMKDIRNRLRSINGTKQITESMRLVSTSKLKKVKLRMEENRPFMEQSIEMARGIALGSLVSKHPYIMGRKGKTSLIIMITGDRGLCGGYNVNVEREALALAKKLGDTQIVTVGIKGREYCRRRKKPVYYSFHGLSENPFSEDAQSIASVVLDMYNDKKVDQIYLVYTEYHSMLSQIPKSICLLPLKGILLDDEKESKSMMRYEPGEESFLPHAVYMYVCSVLFGAMLESAVSEQSARLSSMDAAVKNSNKMVDSLNLKYNQLRQGAITQEIAEIMGGANAVEPM